MRRYEHGGDVYGNPHIELDFSVNTNPLGMPNTVREALIFHFDTYTRYPDSQCRELRSAISRHENVPEDYILCGNGAADLIYRLCYALRPCKALVLAPTFSEYERALEQVDCQVSYHFLKMENQFELTDDILGEITPDIDILFLCNPNNPTGRLVPSDLLESVLTRAKKNHTTVVVDECFLDFTAGESAKSYLEEAPGLIVLKAFTKIYAMAGLRLGYIIASDTELLDKTNAAAQCWSVSTPAQIAGLAALNCTGWIDKTRRLVVEEREFLRDSIGRMGITVYRSEANYLLLQSERPLYKPLLEKGILIRACENFAGLDASFYRIGIKKREENKRFLQALREVLNG